MTVLVTNNDIIDFDSFVNTPEVLSSNVYHDDDYTTYAMKIGPRDIVKQTFSSISQGWIHWHYNLSVGSAASLPDGSPIFEITDGDGDNFLRAVQSVFLVLDFWQFEYWDGALGDWVSFTDQLAVEEKHYFDIEFKIDSSVGFWIVYQDGQEIGRFDGKTDHNGATVNAFNFLGSVGSPSAVDFQAVSQFIITDSESTIDMRLATLEIDGEGATSDWTGAFTDINDQDVDINTKITSGLANDVSTYTVTGLSANVLASAFLNIVAVNVHHYIRDNIGSPSDVQQVVRVASTDFFSPTDTGIGAGYALSINRFTTNPNTTNPWALTDIASLEIGAKSI